MLSKEMLERFYVELTNPDELGLTDSRLRIVFDMALRSLDAGWVPDGWKLVPIEPTQSMLEAGQDEAGELTGLLTVEAIYEAMLAAAPSAQRDHDASTSNT